MRNSLTHISDIIPRITLTISASKSSFITSEIPDIIHARIDGCHNRFGERSPTIFHDMGPPGEEYSEGRKLLNNIPQIFEKL